MTSHPICNLTHFTDFQLDTASVQFLPGDKSKSFIFTAKEDDIKELLETVTLVLIPPTPDNFTVTKGNRSSTEITIEDATGLNSSMCIYVNLKSAFTL